MGQKTWQPIDAEHRRLLPFRDEPYGGEAPHQEHSDTSIAAAWAIKNCSDSIRSSVYSCIAEQAERGATDQEIQIATGCPVSTEVPRRRELELKGRIVDSGYRRRTRSGRQAVVWVVADLPAFKFGPKVPLRQVLYDQTVLIGQLREQIEKLKAELKKPRPTQLPLGFVMSVDTKGAQ